VPSSGRSSHRRRQVSAVHHDASAEEAFDAAMAELDALDADADRAAAQIHEQIEQTQSAKEQFDALPRPDGHG
jgi:hypothetical protein